MLFRPLGVLDWSFPSMGCSSRGRGSKPMAQYADPAGSRESRRQEPPIPSPVSFAVIFSWDTNQDTARYAAATGYRPDVTLRLVVEKLPRSGHWDWAVWKQGDTETPPRTGQERSAALATIAAEATARNWLLAL